MTQKKIHELCKARLFLVCQKGHSVNKSKFIGIEAILEWENISHTAVGKEVQLLCDSAERREDALSQFLSEISPARKIFA